MKIAQIKIKRGTVMDLECGLLDKVAMAALEKDG